jgi:hypothetical protein
LFKPFVANRVSEIQEVTEPQQWHYVPTGENPADIASRGCSVADLIKNELWWQGPPFLMLDDSSWPKEGVYENGPSNEELRKSTRAKSTGSGGKPTVYSLIVTQDKGSTWRLAPTCFSNWSRLKHVLAWVLRFVENCKLCNSNRYTGELTVDEPRDAEVWIIRTAQRDCFSEEIKALQSGRVIPSASKLHSLQPTLDQGVLRSKKRLQFADFLPQDTAFPIIMPRKHWVTKLIIKQIHERGKLIMGTNHVLLELPSKYWIIAAREAIREVERECMECRRRKAKPAKQIMAPLPDDRIRPSFRAFAKVGVDYGGPFVTVQGSGKVTQKRYLCLFTCLVTRAVHLEIAYGLDTDAFLNAFYRMVGRRDLPEKVISDNGTNFVGAMRA